LNIAVLINNLLLRDPQAQKFFKQNAGKSLAFACQDLPLLKFKCIINDNGISIQRNSANEANCYINASFLSLIRLLVQPDVNITELELEIRGDYECAQQLQQVLANLQIDWEEELSKYSGDVVAVHAVQAIKRIRNYQKVNASALEQMVAEYLQHEMQFLPTKYEVNEFHQEIDELRLRVDRLEAKIRYLRSRKQQHASC
jgi:ubiquinone biosynthesis accessory factor UbiJ